MNIISKQQLADVQFDSVKIINEGGYRRFDVVKDGVPSTYYISLQEDNMTTIKATEGTISVRDRVEQGEVVQVGLLQSIDVPDFMKRRQAEMQAKLPPAPIKRTPNQERTFAWWLNEAMKGGDYLE